MKHLITIFIVLFFPCSWAAADSSVWKAQKGNSTMYLGGTVHILRKADLPPPVEFAQAYKAADIVIFETDIAMISDPATQLLLASKAVYADGSTIDRHLSPQTFKELSDYCAAIGFPLDDFKQLKPAMILTFLTILELTKLGVTQQGVDSYFHQLAIKDNKTVKGLETIEKQLNYLVSMADGIEDEFVTYSIREMKSIGPNFDALAAAWRKGDAAMLDRLMLTEMKARWPKLYRKLLTDRNRDWLPVIDNLQQTPGTKYVLVGVAHLVGEDGIIASLKKLGYTVDKL